MQEYVLHLKFPAGSVADAEVTGEAILFAVASYFQEHSQYNQVQLPAIEQVLYLLEAA